MLQCHEQSIHIELVSIP